MATLTSYGVTSQPIGDIAEFNGLVYAGDASGRLYRANIASASLTHVATVDGPGSPDAISRMIPFGGLLYCADSVWGLSAWDGASATIQHLQFISFITGLAIHGGALYASKFSPNEILIWNGAVLHTYRSVSFQPMGIVSFGGALLAVSNFGGLWRITASSETRVAQDVSASGGAGFDPVSLGGALYICNDDATNNGNPRLFRWNGVDAWVAAANQHDGTCRQMRSMAGWRGKLWGTAQNSSHFLGWGGEASWTQEATNATTIGSDVVRTAGGALWLGNGNGSNSIQQVNRGPVQAQLFPASTARPSHVRILRGHRSPDEASAFHNVVQALP